MSTFQFTELLRGTFRGVRHGIVITTIDDFGSSGSGHAIVIVREDALDGHSTPEPADVGTIPTVVFLEFGGHFGANDAPIIVQGGFENDKTTLVITVENTHEEKKENTRKTSDFYLNGHFIFSFESGHIRIGSVDEGIVQLEEFINWLVARRRKRTKIS
jgi:hypothetical protein